MQEKKLSREEVEHSIIGSLAEDLMDDENISFNHEEADIIELTADMEVNRNSTSEYENENENVFHSNQINPFDKNETPVENIDDIVEKAIQNWLDKNLHQIIVKEIEEEFKRIHEESE